MIRRRAWLLPAALAAALSLWNPISQVASYPEPIFEYSDRRPEAIVAVATSRPLVALTFDDGPHPEWTRVVLELLHGFGAHATFFVEGRKVERYPQLVAEEHRRGHEIANHTYRHLDLTRLSGREVSREVRRASLALKRAGVPEARLLRPPRGLYDAEAARAVRRLGYLTVGWNLTVERFVERLGGQEGVEALLAEVRPGSIILTHEHWKMAGETLPLLLEGLRARGYRAVSFGELAGAARSHPTWQL